MKKINRSRVMKLAWAYFKSYSKNTITFSECLRRAWKEEKAENGKAVVASYESFNTKKFGTPWVCKVVDGRYDFDHAVGSYTGNGYNGEAGDLVISHPVINQVYAYGQREYKRGRSEITTVKWNGKEFVPCDKLGR